MELLKPNLATQFYYLFGAAISLTFLILFYYAIAAKGIKKLQTLTILCVAALVMAIPLYFVFHVQISDSLPTTSAMDLDLLMGISLLVLWIAGNYWKDNRRSFVLLYITWGIFLMVSFPKILQNLDGYFNWTPPPIVETKPKPGTLDLNAILREHIIKRETYLANLIKPTIWLIFSIIALFKIRRDQRRAEA